jgi:microcystin degradation protein MlrC
MARIALAGFSHETNTFSPIPTTYENFARREGPLTGILETDELLELLENPGGQPINVASVGFADVMRKHGHLVHPVLMASAEPSRQIPLTVYDRIVDMIVAGLADNGPFDGVFLDLHGAMVYDVHSDGEEEIMRRLRQTVGDIPVVVSYDLHGNITRRCFELADAMVGCRTYPHVDMYETGERCAGLMLHLLGGSPLFKSFKALPFLWPVSRQSTFVEPCKSLYAQIDAVEQRSGVLSATLMAGFQSADVEHQGPTIFTYGLTQKDADDAADFLFDAVMQREGEFRSDLPDAAEAVRRAQTIWERVRKPVILADTCDNSGGGATSDTTGMLRALIEMNVQDAAIGMIYDPQAAEIAHRAGEGAVIEIDLGGKLMPGEQPCKAAYTVEKLHEGAFSGTSPVTAGLPMELGKMAQLRCGGVRIVVSSVRTQAYDRQMFEVVGIRLKEMKIVVVKSANHFRADFEPIAGEIFVFQAHGAGIENPEQAQYKYLRKGVRLQGLGRVNA